MRFRKETWAGLKGREEGSGEKEGRERGDDSNSKWGREEEKEKVNIIHNFNTKKR